MKSLITGEQLIGNFDEEPKREILTTLNNIKLEGDVIGILNEVRKSNILNQFQEKAEVSIEIKKINEIVAVGNGEKVKDFNVTDLVIIKVNKINIENYIIIDSLSDKDKDVIVIIVDYYNIVGKIIND